MNKPEKKIAVLKAENWTVIVTSNASAWLARKVMESFQKNHK